MRFHKGVNPPAWEELVRVSRESAAEECAHLCFKSFCKPKCNIEGCIARFVLLKSIQILHQVHADEDLENNAKGTQITSWQSNLYC